MTLTLLILIGLLSPAKASFDSFQEAALHIVSISPEGIKQLPKRVQSELLSQGCRLPDAQGRINFGTDPASSQTTALGTPWVSGRFGGNGEVGWAAVCLTKTDSKVLVIWEEKAQCPMLVSKPEPLASYVYGGQTMTGNFFYFARALERKTGKQKDILVENGDKGSVEYQCHGKAWRKNSHYH